LICDEKFLFGAQELQKQLKFSLSKDGYRITATKSSVLGLAVETDVREAQIFYSDDSLFFRGLSFAVEYAKQRKSVNVTPSFERMGTMQDCSDGLMSVDGIKKMIRQSALMGYNYLGMYMETTYAVESEPYFGYKTGKYSKQELQEIVAYGQSFCVEIIPFIQTLGHLAQLFKWGEYYEVSDIQNILLAESEKTYCLLEKMITSLADCFTTKRISLGTDEAYFLGRGRYNWFINEENHDYVSLYIKHLQKVVEIAQKHGFSQPEIWCDTIFEMKFKGYIYPPKEIFKPLGKDITDIFPAVTIRMWNYSVTDEKEFSRCYNIVKSLGNDISFAGIAHGYASFAPENYKTARMVGAVKSGCLNNGITDLLITRWETIQSPFSMLAAYYEYAESCCESVGYNREQHCKFLFGYTHAELYQADLPNRIAFDKLDESVAETNAPFYILADDLFHGIMEKHIPPQAEKYYFECEKTMCALAKRNSPFREVFAFEAVLCRTLAQKAPLSAEIKRAYDAGDKQTLSALCAKLSPLARQIKKFHKAYEKYWLTYNKRSGFELFDMRLGGLAHRILTVKRILQEYVSGKISKIEELADERLPLVKGGENTVVCNKDWNGIAVGRLTRL
ncbi:MAG: family 20 glycosylhydrolase, partial [Candidatus Fimimonas sp.]